MSACRLRAVVTRHGIERPFLSHSQRFVVLDTVATLALPVTNAKLFPVINTYLLPVTYYDIVSGNVIGV